MGQCGLGHCVTPVATPRKVPGLEGVKIQQIAAGTSHSIVCTAAPPNRYMLFIFQYVFNLLFVDIVLLI